MALKASSSELKTRAGPLCFSISSATAACLTIAPCGARFPLSTARPPVRCTGFFKVRMTACLVPL
jgi:hypothetical protein